MGSLCCICRSKRSALAGLNGAAYRKAHLQPSDFNLRLQPSGLEVLARPWLKVEVEVEVELWIWLRKRSPTKRKRERKGKGKVVPGSSK